MRGRVEGASASLALRGFRHASHRKTYCLNLTAERDDAGGGYGDCPVGPGASRFVVSVPDSADRAVVDNVGNAGSSISVVAAAGRDAAAEMTLR